MSEIKDGDWVAFQVSKTSSDGKRIYAVGGDLVAWINPKHVTKIPPPDPHAGLVEDIVHYAVSFVESLPPEANTTSYTRPLIRAVAIWRAAQRPPDLVAELRKAWSAVDTSIPTLGSFREVARLIAALEAERDGRKG